MPAVDDRGWRLLFLLRPAALSSFRLLLLLRSAALGSWRLLLLLRPAVLDGYLLLRLSARGGLQVLLFLRPAALSPLLLIRSPAIHPRLRLLSQSLFLNVLLLLLWPLIAACSGRREALARDRHRWRRFAATINTRTGRAIARAWLAGPDLSLPILVRGRIHFTLVVFVPILIERVPPRALH